MDYRYRIQSDARDPARYAIAVRPGIKGYEKVCCPLLHTLLPWRWRTYRPDRYGNDNWFSCDFKSVANAQVIVDRLIRGNRPWDAPPAEYVGQWQPTQFSPLDDAYRLQP